MEQISMTLFSIFIQLLSYPFGFFGRIIFLFMLLKQTLITVPLKEHPFNLTDLRRHL